MTDPEPADKRQNQWFPALAAAGAALAVYALTLCGTYVYDDLFMVQRDPRLADPRLWWQFWTRDYFNGGPDNLYRPLVSMTYALQLWLHGDRPWAFHLVNWLLHAAVSAAAVAELARRLIGNRVAYLAGLLFAVHPIHVEVVAGIVGRAELMAALPTLIALLLFIPRPITTPRAVAIWGCFIVAVLSKEQGMFLPPLLLIWEFTRRRMGGPRQRGQGMSWLIALLTLSLAGYIIWREFILKFWWDRAFLDWTINPVINARGRDMWLVPVALIGRYLSLMIAPIQLCIDWGTSIPSDGRVGDPYLWLGFGALIAWGFGVVASLRRRKGVILFCLLAAALYYAMIGNFLTIIGTVLAERLMYLPSVFLVILAAAGIARLRRGAMITIACLLLSVYSLRTVTYAWLWNDRLRLYEWSLEHNPRSIRMYLLVAEERHRLGDTEGAKRTLEDATDEMPDYWMIWWHRAIIAFLEDDMQATGEYLRRGGDLKREIYITPVAQRYNERMATQPSTAPQK